MRYLIADVETDGFLHKMTKVHSLVITDITTGVKVSCTDNPYKSDTHKVLSIAEGAKMLMAPDVVIVGHNFIKFDLWAIKIVHPWFTWDEDRVIDTLVLSNLLWPNLSDIDIKRMKSGKLQMPGVNVGKHRLEAWGYRLGKQKGEYATIKKARLAEQFPDLTDAELTELVWRYWDPEMQEYCELDVDVNVALWQRILQKDYPKNVTRLEHTVQFIVAQMEQNGFPFDYKKAEELTALLQIEKAKAEAKLTAQIKPWWVSNGPIQTVKRTMIGRKPTTPTRYEGGKYQKIKMQVFNPGSRKQIAERMQTLFGWVPTERTPTGEPKVDESTLNGLQGEIPKLVIKYLTIDKRLGQIAEGKEAWLKHYRPETKSIHGSINPLGTVTRRGSHSSPNLSQVPAVGKIYGAECRELFRAREGMVQVGKDASGLELRMLGHFLAPYDGGAYAREVVNGDIHWVNVVALGLVPEGTEKDPKSRLHKLLRDGTKTFIYAFLYGSGNANLASIIHKMLLKISDEGVDDTLLEKFFKGDRGPTEKTLRTVGGRIKQGFLKRLPALKQLIDAVKMEAQETGYVVTLDGGPIPVRSLHSALNALLQSAGAVVCKVWMVEFRKRMIEAGLWQVYYFVMMWSHDEIQGSSDPEYAEQAGQLSVDAIRAAGEILNLNVPLDGEYIVGANWKECH